MKTGILLPCHNKVSVASETVVKTKLLKMLATNASYEHWTSSLSWPACDSY